MPLDAHLMAGKHQGWFVIRGAQANFVTAAFPLGNDCGHSLLWEGNQFWAGRALHNPIVWIFMCGRHMSKWL